VKEKKTWLKSLKTFNFFWYRLETIIYELSTLASQVYFHKKLTHFTLIELKLVNEFLEEWQNTLEQTFIVSLNFIEQ
jgi:hypothetical protein